MSSLGQTSFLTLSLSPRQNSHSLILDSCLLSSHSPSLPLLLWLVYLKVSRLARRERKPGDLAWPFPPSLLAPSSPFLPVSSSSMVISTRPESFSSPPTLSIFLTTVSRCLGWAIATAERMGWSRRSASPPQPFPVSYFLSLRDSCFFFSEAAAFTLEGSAGGAGPCGGGRRGGRGENREGESLQEERSVGERGRGKGRDVSIRMGVRWAGYW